VSDLRCPDCGGPATELYREDPSFPEGLLVEIAGAGVCGGRCGLFGPEGSAPVVDFPRLQESALRAPTTAESGLPVWVENGRKLQKLPNVIYHARSGRLVVPPEIVRRAIFASASP
jgi:hypothetical protein